MDRNKSDINTSCSRKIRLILMCYVSNVAGLRHSVAKEMTSYSHTLACFWGKFRSGLEAGKKQFGVWLKYVCSVAEMLLYSFFDAHSVFLWLPYCNSENLHIINEESIVFLRYDGHFAEMSRRHHGKRAEVYASTNPCSSILRSGVMYLCSHVQMLMYLCPFLKYQISLLDISEEHGNRYCTIRR